MPIVDLLPPYITFFPLLGTIPLSLDYELPQNFLLSSPILFRICPLPLSDFIIVVSLYLLCIFVCVPLFLCTLLFIFPFSLWLLLPINVCICICHSNCTLFVSPRIQTEACPTMAVNSSINRACTPYSLNCDPCTVQFSNVGLKAMQ